MLDFLAKHQAPDSPAPDDVKEYLFNFMRRVNGLKEDLCSRDAAVTFGKCFFGKGLPHCFSLLKEVYSLRYFHRFLSRDAANVLMQTQSLAQHHRGQFLLRFATRGLKEGYLALDTMRTDLPSGTWSTLVRFNGGAWIMGEGHDQNGQLVRYEKLQHLHERNRNVLLYPVFVENNVLYYEPGWHAFPPNDIKFTGGRCANDGTILAPHDNYCSRCGRPVAST